MQAQKLASLGDLVAGIAHEINTPLGALQANVDVLQRAFGILSDALQDEELGDLLRRNERVARALSTLERTRAVTPEATQRIARIVRDLKSFARLDQASEESVDLRELIESALAVLKYDLGERITVVRELAVVPKLRCRPQELNQVFFNVLTNAIQSISEQGTITVSTRTDGNTVVALISDTGSGIAEEQLRRISIPGSLPRASAWASASASRSRIASCTSTAARSAPPAKSDADRRSPSAFRWRPTASDAPREGDRSFDLVCFAARGSGAGDRGSGEEPGRADVRVGDQGGDGGAADSDRAPRRARGSQAAMMRNILFITTDQQRYDALG